MKKKILTICLVVALLATAVGGTLAYFTDTDAQKNTFTTGNVAIDLWEDFGDNDALGIEELIPAVGSAQNGTLKNGVEKENETCYTFVTTSYSAGCSHDCKNIYSGNNKIFLGRYISRTFVVPPCRYV